MEYIEAKRTIGAVVNSLTVKRMLSPESKKLVDEAWEVIIKKSEK